MSMELQAIKYIKQIASEMNITDIFTFEYYTKLNRAPTLAVRVDYDGNSIHPLIDRLNELELDENMDAGVYFNCQINIVVSHYSLDKLSKYISLIGKKTSNSTVQQHYFWSSDPTVPDEEQVEEDKYLNNI